MLQDFFRKGSELMRIEKINDRQIRCTLNQKDLSDRELRISELAYGTEKAKSLFRDMMQQASYEFGFDAEDIPLMIEAIPMYPDSLVLIITKVDEPEELDTRFSHFSEDLDDDAGAGQSVFTKDNEDIPDDVLDALMDDNDKYPSASIHDDDDDGDDDNDDDDELVENMSGEFVSLSEALGMKHHSKSDYTDEKKQDFVRVYYFHSLDAISKLAENLIYSYQGENSIFKDEKKKIYYLVVHRSTHTAEEFNKVCNIICEYGKPVRNTYASGSFYEEHFEALIKEKALQVLASI
jgi:adapter protein MecA 1/2